MKKTILGIIILFFFSGCLGEFYQYKKQPSLPKRSGELALPGLKGKVEVYFDEYGVPHIFADNEPDLFFAVGYIQAQDRLFEMVLLRAMAEGRMAELLGDLRLPINMGGISLKTVQYDTHQRIYGLKYLGEIGEEIGKRYLPQVYNQAKAYVEGINTYIRLHQDSLPVEFRVLNYQPEEFRVADVLSLGLFIGSWLSANQGEELLRYALMKKYGWEMTWKLVPWHPDMGPTIVPKQLLKNRLAQPVKDILKDTPRPEELDLPAEVALLLDKYQLAMRQLSPTYAQLASNNWAVSGKLTKNGSAILCNDPHLVHIEPSLFYLMHIKGAGFDAYGVAFPGAPYIVLGHTRKLAWAATTSRADAEDLFIEKLNPKNPEQYLYKGKWRNFVQREEIIKIRVGLTNKYRKKKIKIRQSIHGPIINPVLDSLPKDTPPIAYRWTGWDFTRDLKVFELLVESSSKEEFLKKFDQYLKEHPAKLLNIALMYNHLMKGSSIEDFKKAMEYIIVPNQNWVGADADGHIIYLPGGLVPIRKKGRGLTPVPGWSGEYDWIGFIPLFELPYMIDPERGYIATANNEVVDIEWYPYTFGSNYTPGWRASRIEELIKKMAPLDVEKMKKIQNDIYSKEAEALAPLIVRAVEKKASDQPGLKEAVRYLKNWDYLTDTESIATTIYYATMLHLYDNVLADELDPEFYQAWLAHRRINIAVQYWLLTGNQEFFDDKRTKDKVEDIDDMLVKSLSQAISWLEKNLGKDMSQWQWGKLHTIKWSHPLGMGPFKDLSVGPYPHLGSESVVRNAPFTGSGKNPFKSRGGPVLRHIIDLSKPDQAQIVIDGSQSGNWLDPHYQDMHQLWLNSEYITATMNPAQVKKQAKSRLVLVPE